MILFGLSAPVCDVIRPRPFEPTPEWACRNISLPNDLEIKGQMRLDLFPHSREPLEAFDDPGISEITLQWGSRLGKTMVAMACCAKVAATNPNPMAWADADQKGTERCIKRLWKILAKVPVLADHCPPPRLRAADKIEFPEFLIHGAWSGSASSAADFAAYLIVLNEIDKMSKNKSDEADFAELMAERAKGFARYKVLKMSTPSYVGRSRVEASRKLGDNRGRFVPCPRCNHWQQLWTGDGSRPGGLRWEKPSSGKSDKQLAKETAWYECSECARRISNSERFDLLNSGVWVPDGMRVVGSGKLVGKPNQPGPHASFGPLPTLYSLMPGTDWGTVAYKFLDSRDTREHRRNYHNSWESLTWDAAPQKFDHLDLISRLSTNEPRGWCPGWTVFLTRGVDVLKDGKTFWWTVFAWGRGRRGALIDWGVSDSIEIFSDMVRTQLYPHTDGGDALRPLRTLIDSGDGNHTNEIYSLCFKLRGLGTLPCKGVNNSAFPGAFRLGGVDDGTTKHTDMQQRLLGLPLINVNGEQSQWWIENVLSGDTSPDAPNGFTLPTLGTTTDGQFRLADDEMMLLNQLVNEYPDRLINKHGYPYHTWEKRKDGKSKNEWRDASRYAWCGAQIQTRNGQLWEQIRRQPAIAAAAPESRPAFAMPDGRPYLVTERR